MPMKLRDALVETTARWQEQLPAAWRDAVGDVQLDAAAVNGDYMIDPWVPIFPNCGLSEVLGGPKVGNRRIYHTFRALQLVPPGRVKVVVLGQDPYPDIAKATGASFEQGGLVDWVKDAHRVAASLRNILLCAAAAETGRAQYLDPANGWTRFVDALSARRLALPAPYQLFPAYGRQGVLWLNTTLTISLFREGPNKTEVHQTGHAAYWRPLVNRLLASLVSRPKKQLIVALWGTWANRFREPLTAEVQPVGAADRLHFVTAPHPVNETFLTKKNSLADINATLQKVGEDPIAWLPPATDG
jgi:uracil-DNA glycosylase